MEFMHESIGTLCVATGPYNGSDLSRRNLWLVLNRVVFGWEWQHRLKLIGAF